MTQLGTTPRDDGARDAVHVAIVACQSEVAVHAGEEVVLVSSTAPRPVMVEPVPGGAVRLVSPIGIVDPFNHYPLPPGTRFWVCLFPGTTTALHHCWTHPAFDVGAIPENSALLSGLRSTMRFDEESTPGAAPPPSTRSMMMRDHFAEPAPPPEPREVHLSTGIAPAAEDDEDEDEEDEDEDDEDDEEPTYDRRDDDDGACGRCES